MAIMFRDKISFLGSTNGTKSLKTTSVCTTRKMNDDRGKRLKKN